MNDVYGRVSTTRLLPRERDAVTGRLTARREDKRQDADSSPRPPSRGRLTRSTRWWGGAGLAAALVSASVVGAVALTGSDDRDGDSRGATVPLASPSDPPSPATPTAAAATAVQLDYTGGRLTRAVCTSSVPGETCTGDVDFGFDPLPVRCTPTDCTVYFFDGATAVIGERLSISGSYSNAPCPDVFWTLELTPSGEAVTEGIRHPARLVGTATARRAALNLTDQDCLSGDYVYRYDAAP